VSKLLPDFRNSAVTNSFHLGETIAPVPNSDGGMKRTVPDLFKFK
jgi:serine protease inhibitor ecotin